MDDPMTIAIGVSGLFLTIINVLVVVIVNKIFSSITRIEDKHVTAITAVFERIDKDRQLAHEQREDDLKALSAQQKLDEREFHKVKTHVAILSKHTDCPLDI